MAALISPELLKRLEQLQLLARRRSKSSAKGERRSGARGQSVEFADYRAYVPGDDLRWNYVVEHRRSPVGACAAGLDATTQGPQR
jgi:hypothetical protein